MMLNKRERLFIHPVVFVNTFDNRRKKIQNLSRGLLFSSLFYHKRNGLSKEERKRIKLIKFKKAAKAKVSRLYHFSIQQPWQGLVHTSGKLVIQKFYERRCTKPLRNVLKQFSFIYFSNELSQSVKNVSSFKTGSTKLCTENFQKSHVSPIFV